MSFFVPLTSAHLIFHRKVLCTTEHAQNGSKRKGMSVISVRGGLLTLLGLQSYIIEALYFWGPVNLIVYSTKVVLKNSTSMNSVSVQYEVSAYTVKEADAV